MKLRDTLLQPAGNVQTVVFYYIFIWNKNPESNLRIITNQIGTVVLLASR